MPVALRQGGLRYYFFSNEGQPPELPIFMSKAAAGTPRFGLSLAYQ
jgi:hypothetical protein